MSLLLDLLLLSQRVYSFCLHHYLSGQLYFWSLPYFTLFRDNHNLDVSFHSNVSLRSEQSFPFKSLKLHLPLPGGKAVSSLQGFPSLLLLCVCFPVRLPFASSVPLMELWNWPPSYLLRGCSAVLELATITGPCKVELSPQCPPTPNFLKHHTCFLIFLIGKSFYISF